MLASPTVPPSKVAVDQAESTRLRLTFLTLLVVGLFVLLFARLWFIQVMAGERYVDLAQGNAVRTISVEAPRGKILDRAGEPIVRNRYAMVVSVRPDEMGEREDQVLADLAHLLGLSVDEIRARIESSQVSPFRPKPVAIDVPQDVVFYIHENNATRFPGVYAEQLPLREYPHGATAAHVVGYVGEISEAELEQERFADYQQGDEVGWAGVERSLESALRGSAGERRLEVNAAGQVVRNLGEQLPTPGSDVRLTLDLEAQQLVEQALREGIETARTVQDRESGPGRGGTFKAPAGAVVVLDTRSGEVIAIASHPTFEPAQFVGGVSQTYWDALQAPENHFPLINRAIQSSYPPGSTFKVVSAAAALENGYVEPNTPVPCPGSWEWNGTIYRNWTSSHMGSMGVVRSLADSCDTYYYELARRMWTDEQNEGEGARERLPEMAEAFGFGKLTGIDLPSERAGVVPGRAWKREYWENNRDQYCTLAQQSDPGSYAQALYTDLCNEGHRWRGGDTVNMSIGQGDLQTTPLQLANAFAALANGGTLYRPHVTKAIEAVDGTVEEVEPEPIGQLPVSPENLGAIWEGLLQVTRPGGTAGSVFGDFPVPVAGKTGTAEMKPKQPSAWFAGVAPADAGPDTPQYAVVAMVEEGGGGSQTAAPIVRRVFENLLGLEQTSIDVGVATD